MVAEGSDAGGLVGTVLAGRYRILSLLGEGAMGAVYLGEHLKIGRRDAIKVLRPSMARDEEAIARFTRGARHASGIRHPNVCAIYDFGTTEQGLHFLAMEFVDGGSLSEVMAEEGRLPVPRATAILLQAAGALQVAHERGVIHRDLKPDNIMLAREQDGSERVKVVDFDIALGPQEGEGARVTRHGYVVGTPEYMSPEQLTGDPLDARSDVYSLALVFFRMLAGRLPFESGTAQEVMIRRLTAEPLSLREAAPDAGIPDALEPVLRKGLARTAQERYSSAAEFARAVHDAVGEVQPAAFGSPGAAAAGAGAFPEGGRGAVPPTRVSSTADERGARSGDERRGAAEEAGVGGGAWPPSRPVLMAGGAAVALMGLAAGAFLVTSSGSGDPEAGAPAETAGPVEGVPAGTGEAAPGELSREVAAEEPGTGPTGGATEEAATGGEADPPAEPPAAETATAERDPSPDPPTPSPTVIRLPAENAADLLVRQLLARDEPGGETRPSLEAIRDTTMAVWSSATMSRGDSALASYILGSALISLGDSLRGVGWLEEAVRLDPQRGYVELLELHRGGSR